MHRDRAGRGDPEPDGIRLEAHDLDHDLFGDHDGLIQVSSQHQGTQASCAGLMACGRNGYLLRCK